MLSTVLTTTSESILSSDVVSFVTDAMGDVIGILTTPPLGIFLTIGILGTIVGLVGRVVSTVKNA